MRAERLAGRLPTAIRGAQTPPREELPDHGRRERGPALRRSKPLAVEMLGDLGRAPLGRPQFDDPAHEPIEVAQLVVPPDRARDLVLADIPAGPMDPHVRVLGPGLDRHDDPLDEVADDRLAIRSRRPLACRGRIAWPSSP
jgi:hypothetical protein